MSTNCIRCVVKQRTGLDLLCDDCREIRHLEAQALKDRELLGQVADLGIESVWPGKEKGGTFRCLFCKQRGNTPPTVIHTEGCLIARIQKHLSKE